MEVRVVVRPVPMEVRDLVPPGTRYVTFFLVNGRPTNPQRKDMGTGTPVPKRLQAAYAAVRDHLLTQLEPKAPVTPPLPAAPAVASTRD